MAKYVVSTLSADNRYTDWKNDNGTNNPAHSVLVKGGARVADPRLAAVVSSAGVNYKEGVLTEVSDADAAFLEKNTGFKFHQERGFVKIITVNKNPETVARSMEVDDGSRPRTGDDVRKFAKDKGKDGDETLQAVVNAGRK
jgi:hypothetical protein